VIIIQTCTLNFEQVQSLYNIPSALSFLTFFKQYLVSFIILFSYMFIYLYVYTHICNILQSFSTLTNISSSLPFLPDSPQQGFTLMSHHHYSFHHELFNMLGSIPFVNSCSYFLGYWSPNQKVIDYGYIFQYFPCIFSFRIYIKICDPFGIGFCTE
jgi:hypothetical protein